MKDCLVLIDSNYLCWRAAATTGGLTHNEMPTGVIYGFLRSIRAVSERYNTDDVIFCFDSSSSLRQVLYPGYKTARREKHRLDPVQQSCYRSIKNQISQLRKYVLPELGYQNILYSAGYEADDIIASIIRDYGTHTHIIISGDSDLYQLLSSNVMMYDPRSQKVYNEVTFEDEFGITPDRWALVKAIAGDKSDSIPGVPGVGIKTAIKYLQGGFKPKTVTHRSIVANQKLISENMKLVRLPFDERLNFRLTHQEPISPACWRQVMEKFGIKTIPPRGGFFGSES